ncbi:MAG: PKD domain-containing protein [Bacteroidia bacterium]|nr:PKD domain-containing protein [Bacteroidia bacterium]
MNKLLRFMLLLGGLGVSGELRAQVNANFTASQTSGCSPLTVTFTDLSTGPVNAWAWDFGNGNTSNFDDVIATYTAPGTYTVSLTVQDTVGGVSSTRTQVGFITVFEDPSADFSAPLTAGCAPLTVNFADVTVPGDAPVVSWSWDFGDGSLGTGASPAHTYMSGGSYTVTLVTVDANGCTDTRIRSGYINVTDLASVDFTASPRTACAAPLVVNFTPVISPAGSYTYLWDFGDGVTSSSASPTHIYSSNGDYTVTLTITDPLGCQEQVQKNNYVLINSPVADFYALDTTVCAGIPVQFGNNTIGADGYLWSFGDGNTSTTANPSHTYAAPGLYTVSLTATNSAGCSDFSGRSGYIRVYAAPATGFTANDPSGCTSPMLVQFTDNSVGTIASWFWNFGNGDFSTAPNPQTTYTTPGLYDVSLTVTTADGCTATETIPSYIQLTLPDAAFLTSLPAGCVPLTVSFADLSTSPADPIVSWVWNFGDGSISTQQNPSHTYTLPGLYTVVLTVITQSGCQAIEQYQYVQAGTRPNADFTATPRVVCTAENVNFTDLTTGGATAWFWSFGDGGTSLAQNPAYAYLDTGYFTVTLVAEYLGCRDTIVRTDYIHVVGPVANFLVSPGLGCDPPIDISFFDQSSNATSWNWSFGDGTGSTLQNPVHTFTGTGTFEIDLVVSDSLTGCVSDFNYALNITSPRAGFSPDDRRGCAPFTVGFANTSIDATNYIWDFGDGSLSTAAAPSHTYQAPGTYTVTLVASDGSCSDTLIMSSLIRVVGPQPAFSTDLITGCAPLAIRFNDLSVPDAGTSLVSWSWDFGDGNTGSGPSPVHTYTSAGSFDVTLQVLDSEGCLAQITRQSLISPTLPVAAFSATDTIACPGSLVQFINQSTGTGLSYFWSFGDGTTSTVPNPVKLFAPNASYTVTLTVTDANGCTDTEIKLNYVSVGQPTAAFVADTTTATCPPLTVSFTDQSSPNVVSWYWDFGDGSTSTLRNPAKIYSLPGTYDVTLIVTTAQNCRDTLRMNSLINIQGPTGAFSFAPTSGCQPLNVTFLTSNPNPSWTYTWDFGDGVGGTGTVVTHTYYTDTVASPVMLVQDNNGCIVAVTNPTRVTILPLPRPAFQVNTNEICLGQSVRFTNTTISERTVTGYLWSFGDGNTSSAINPSHTYTDTGVFVVSLVATTVDGCMDTSSVPVTIRVTGPPQAIFTMNPAQDCEPAVITFTEASISYFSLTAWAWDFGDGFSDNGQVIPSHTYATDGSYQVTLTVTDSKGCTGSSTRSVLVTPVPTVAFTANRYGCAPSPVTFTDASTAAAAKVAWLWTFGDGTSSTLQNPVKTYTADGNYTVSLTVTDANGCTNTLTVPNYIRLSHPTASFTSNARRSCPPQRVRFTDQSVPDTTLISWFWDFGDGNTSSVRNPSHTYYTPGNYDVTLIVTNVLGCTDTFVIPNHVRINNRPTASFTVSDSANCVPENIIFTSTSVSGGSPITTYTWNYGAGSGGTGATTSYLYTNPGTYNATLIVRDANNCRDTATKVIQIFPNPDANFIAGDTVGCSTTTIAFTDLTTGVNAPVAWTWNFGDSGIGTSQNPAHTYFADGTYTVSLLVEDVNGCRDSVTRTNYIILDHPDADFTTSAVQACPGTTVQFSDRTTGRFAAVNWRWDFGDGSPVSTAQNPAHIYTTPGVYSVSLIVWDAIGCSDTLVRSLLVNVPVPPQASFSYTPTQGCDPLTVSFTNGATAGSSPIVSWVWTFGDGNTAFAPSPTHTYTTPGVYTATLSVTDANGCNDTYTQTVRVLEVPVVNFIADQRRGCAPAMIRFTDLSTSPYLKVSWFWDFGDGNTSTSPAPVHTYLADGNYTVKLIVTDLNGCRDSLTRTNYIRLSHPVANFSLDQTQVCPNIPVGVSFTDLSVPDTTLMSWLWNFGDGNTSTAQNPTHSYAAAGNFVVTLTVTNVLGCTDTYTAAQAITVLDPPVTAFSHTDSAGCAPHAVSFTDLSTPGDAAVVNWAWDFGNGATSLVRNPSYTWTVPGFYTVTLTTTDFNGCQTSATTQVRVYDNPVANFVSQDTLGCAPQAVTFTNLSTQPSAIVYRKWYFGDGDSAINLVNPTHTYTADGIYDVTLIVEDIYGCNDTIVKSDYIRLSHPVAGIGISQSVVCPGIPIGVQFTDQTAPDTTLISWYWQFGDGNTSSAQNPTHSYAVAGNYTVILTVTNILGCTDSDTLTGAITVLDPPQAQLSVADADGCIPFVASFTQQVTAGDAAIIDWLWRFGDGTTSFVQNPVKTYPSAGTYPVTLIVTDANGCQDSVSTTVRAYANPVARFVASDTIGCAPETITFSDQSTSTTAISAWLWNFGDGNTSTLRNPTHTYTANGTYTVTLTVTDANGCTHTFSRPNYIRLTLPVANFTWDLSNGCPGTTVTFRDASIPDHPTVAWSWNFGDGGTSTLANPGHTYHTPGTYTVTLTITNTQGCTDTEVKTAIITIYQRPVAAILPADTAGCAPLSVDFRDGTVPGSSGLVSWSWSFGNGNTFTGFNPGVQTYPTPGLYTTQLIVTDGNGCRDTATTTVRSRELPTAAFTANQTQSCAPAAIRFTDLSSGTGAVTGWKWYFGDGDSATVRNPLHVYAMEGVYTVTLIVVDQYGCSDTVTRNNYIRLRHPVANFTASSTDICPGDQVSFTDLSTADTTLISWAWSFGNGQTSTLQNPSTVYSSSGFYTVSLIVTNQVGCRDTLVRTSYIEVATRPAASFTIADSAGCTPHTTSFSQTSTAATWPIVAYAWDLGNGTTAILPNPVATYTTPGVYNVSLVTTDQNGCTDTATAQVQAYTLPVAAFTANVRVGCAPQTINFINQSGGTYPLVSYLWDFGDGNTSTSAFPAHTYASDGVYTVSLTVTDLNGCQHTLTRPAFIRLTHPVANFTMSQTAVCPGVAVSFTDISTPDTTLNAWTWDFGDGTGSSLQHPSHTYTVPGNYTVTLTVRNVLNCSDTEVKTAVIQVQQAPGTAFVASVLSGCSPLDIAFTNTTVITSQPVVSWYWEFGNGATSTLVSPVYTYPAPGTYTVRLTATDALGCISTAEQVITVYPLPVADFSANRRFGCAPEAITFQSQGTGVYPVVAWWWDFGDGNTSTLPVPVHTYAATGVYDVSLIVQDVNGCRDTVVKQEYIRLRLPDADFLVSDQEICPGTTVQFTETAIADTTLTGWTWNFGDGNTSTLQHPSHTYQTPGLYTVRLTVTNVLGCTHTEEKTAFIEVLTPPTPDFSITPAGGCAPLLVSFRDLSAGNPAAVVSWSWDFGNGLTSAVRNPTTLYPVPGTYTVTLTVTDAKGCVNTVTRQVPAYSSPAANFIASDSIGCEENIRFFDLTTGDYAATAWKWYFGDGDSSLLQNPVHTYPATGTYSVTLIVYNAYGCSDTLVKPEYIDLTRPAAAFGQGSDVVCPGTPLQFMDLSVPDYPITTWSWNFGDGNTGTGPNPSHTFTMPGIYTVTLTITNIFGCTDSESGLVEVLRPPVARYTVPDRDGCAPFTTTMTNTSQSFIAPIVAYFWDFGDGTNAATASPVHTWANPGTYTVQLRVTDGNGCEDDTSFVVTVFPLPVADFEADPVAGCAPETVQFTSLSGGTHPIVGWLWTFGDGNTSTAEHPLHTYTADGLYTVSLTVTDVNGCSHTFTRPQYIRLRHPVANFTYTPGAACPGSTINFTNTSVADTTLVTYLWDFGDGTTSAQVNPAHVYTTPGLYTVSLTVTNLLGCTDTEVKTQIIRIHTPPVAAFVPTDAVGCVPETVQFFSQATPGTAAITGYQWSFGNGLSSTLPNPVTTYALPGLFNAQMVVRDANNCRDTVTHQVNVRALPAPAFVANITRGCAPQAIAFFDQTTGSLGITGWLWDFGDGNTSTQQFPVHTYQADGVYTVSLTVTDNFGCNNTLVKPQYIRLSRPAPDFTVNLNPICPGSPVQFTNLTQADTTIATWLWSFGDGTTSTLQNPVKSYSTPGFYTVSLTATNVNGCAETRVRTQYIQVLDRPNAGFTPDKVAGCVPLTVTFSNTSVATSAPLAGWFWDFGNGSSSIFTNPTQTFNQPGVYPVRLVAIDAQGCGDTVVQNITVFTPPTSNFIAAENRGCAPVEIPFLDQSQQGSAPITSWFWSFGDGNGSGQQFPAHTYLQDGSYDVTLVVSDANGCRDTLVRPDYIQLSHPAADFAVSSVATCPGTVMAFFDRSVGDTTLASWFWSFGDGTTSFLQNPTHTYTANGTYTVTLTVTNILGCSHTITRNQLIQVYSPATTLFVPSQPQGCTPFEVSFQDQSFGNSAPIVAWSWDFGDGTGAAVQNPAHTYTTPGLYTVTLTTTDNNGCQSSYTRTVRALTLPTARFMSVDTIGCAPETVRFSDLSRGDFPIQGWYWDFGDGNTSTAQHPVHIYALQGVYTVTLIATDLNGCQDTFVRPQYIRLRNPDANFSISPGLVCPGTPVSFTDLSIPDTTIASWSWNFGDGTTSVVQHPTHLYAQPGVYTVSLTVTNVLGCYETHMIPGGVVVANPPSADFLLADSIGCTPFEMDITDNSRGISAPIVSWQWNFGNGATSSLQEPLYTYNFPGTYVITLTVTDENGCSATTSHTVVATRPPVAQFVSADTLGCAPHQAAFVESSRGDYPITGWYWDFGDGNTSTQRQPVHLYTQDGIFTVTLIITDQNGCTDTLVRPAYIRLSHPQAGFTANSRGGCVGTEVTYTDVSIPDTTITGWAWDFGDGQGSVQQHPTHVYNQPGVYDVTLVVTNILGCRDTFVINDYIRITAPPTAAFTASDTSGCVPFQVAFTDWSTSQYGITQWQWFLDGSPKGNSQNISHYFVETGTYEIMLVVTDANGCTDTLTQLIYVRPVPQAAFETSDTLGCGPKIVVFTDRSFHIPTSWQWNFGDGTTSTDQNPVHTYQADGIYTVSLYIEDQYGCNDRIEKINHVTLDHPEADFTASYDPSCPPVRVTFRATGTGLKGIAKWDWDFGNGTITTTLIDSLVYAYNQSGIYSVSLTATDSLGCEVTVVKPDLINVLDNVIPDPVQIHTVSVLSNTQIELRFAAHRGEDFKQYTVYREEPGQGFVPVFVTTYVNDTIFLDQGVNANLRSYCYKVTATNYCDTESNLGLTEAHCTIEAEAVPIPGQIILSWTPYRGWVVDHYEIYQVDSYNPNLMTFLDVVPGTVTRYVENFADCFNDRAYRIRAFGAEPIQVSLSDTAQAVTAQGIRGDAPEMVRATVEDNARTVVEWKPVVLPGLSVIHIEKAVNGGAYSTAATLPPGNEKYTDTDTDVSQNSYAYRVYGQDSCGNVTPLSDIGKTVLLTAERDGGTTVLEWTPYEDWRFGVANYVIETLNATSGNWETVRIVSGNVVTFRDTVTSLNQPQYCYRIRALEQGNNEAISFSNEVCVRSEATVYAPNAFTPNGDGINDAFKIEGFRVQSVNLKIYSRWGMLLFETNDLNQGWDGTYKGENVNEGVYVFVARGVAYTGKPFLLKGSVTVLR